MANRLDDVIEKLKALPKERQSDVIDVVEKLVGEPVKLSDEELAVLLPALEAVQRGEVVSEDEIRSILDEPW